MSIKIMNSVWQDAPYRGNTLLTLLALADWANDEGVCWPQMESLAEKSRQSVRSTQYAIEQLIADNIVEAEINPGKGRRNVFRVMMQNLHHSKRCKSERQMVQNSTPNGAKRDSAIRKNHQEPSRNHQAISLKLQDRIERDRRSRLTRAAEIGLRDYSQHPLEDWEKAEAIA